MRALLVVVLLSDLVAGCRANRETWPRSAGVKPFFEHDAGQSLVPQAPVMEAIEKGGDSPVKAAKVGHGRPNDAAMNSPSVPSAPPMTPAAAEISAPQGKVDGDDEAVEIDEGP